MGLVRIVQTLKPAQENIVIEIYPYHHQIILSILSPIRGGGDYRGIYDIGLKRGFMGYI
jgi:hypothetical protein